MVLVSRPGVKFSIKTNACQKENKLDLFLIQLGECNGKAFMKLQSKSASKVVDTDFCFLCLGLVQQAMYALYSNISDEKLVLSRELAEKFFLNEIS